MKLFVQFFLSFTYEKNEDFCSLRHIAKFQILSPSMKSYLQTIQMKPLQ